MKGETGGGVLHAVYLAKEWERLGNNVAFITNASDYGYSAYDGVTNISRLPSLRRPFVLDMFFNYIIQRRSVIPMVKERCGNEQRDDTIVIATGSYPSDVLAAFLVSRNLKLKSVVFFHHLFQPPWRHPFKRGGLIRTSVNWFLNQAALSIVKIGNLSLCLDYPIELDELGWRFKSGVLKDSNFLPSEDRDVHQDATNERSISACFVGRVSINKGVLDLLKAWKSVVKELPRACLIIAGNPVTSRFARRLTSFVDRFHLKNNVYLDFRYVDEKEKQAILASSRLFIFPSYEEGWSLSVMEAASYGALPVTYDLHAYGYLGPNAIKVKAGCIKDLSIAIVDILRDEKKRLNLAAELRERVILYHGRDIGSEMLQKFRQL